MSVPEQVWLVTGDDWTNPDLPITKVLGIYHTEQQARQAARRLDREASATMDFCQVQRAEVSA